MFLMLGIFDPSRVIHMNMEISLLLAHLCLMPSLYDKNQEACRVLSLLMNYFFLTCFSFMFLEAIYLYSIVGWVVRKVTLVSDMVNSWCHSRLS